VKTAYVDGQLYLEVHPPVDAQGQSTEPNMELLSQLLDKALGDSTAAINWDIARDELRAANGIPAVVGLEAVLDPQPAQAQSGGSAGSPDAASGAGSPNTQAGPANTAGPAPTPAPTASLSSETPIAGTAAR
jgi:hypothetical protein